MKKLLIIGLTLLWVGANAQVIDFDKAPDFVGFTSKFPYDTTVYFVGGGINNNAPGTRALNNATILAYPFWVGKTMTFDLIAIEVTTGSGSTHIVCGIYEDNGNIQPGKKLINSKVFDGSSARVQTDMSCGTFTLYAGRVYWVAFNADGTPTVRALNPASIPNLMGYITGASGQYGGYYYSLAYNATLPATFTVAGATKLVNNAMPIIYMRLK